jgi:hypothetical protein
MADPVSEVNQLRSQGLSDDLIKGELTKKGYTPDQLNLALSQADASMPAMGSAGPGFSSQPMPSYSSSPSSMHSAGGPPPVNGANGNIYERIEEITESIIDEKWDELLAEVKKIIEWKELVEERQNKMQSSLDKLKGDFNVLHQGVLGKLDAYDTRMQDVGTELNAVGKVFKDVVPQFVENVKELSHITGKMKK